MVKLKDEVLKEVLNESCKGYMDLVKWLHYNHKDIWEEYEKTQNVKINFLDKNTEVAKGETIDKHNQ